MNYGKQEYVVAFDRQTGSRCYCMGYADACSFSYALSDAQDRDKHAATWGCVDDGGNDNYRTYLVVATGPVDAIDQAECMNAKDNIHENQK